MIYLYLYQLLQPLTIQRRRLSDDLILDVNGGDVQVNDCLSYCPKCTLFQLDDAIKTYDADKTLKKVKKMSGIVKKLQRKSSFEASQV